MFVLEWYHIKDCSCLFCNIGPDLRHLPCINDTTIPPPPPDKASPPPPEKSDLKEAPVLPRPPVVRFHCFLKHGLEQRHLSLQIHFHNFGCDSNALISINYIYAQRMSGIKLALISSYMILSHRRRCFHLMVLMIFSVAWEICEFSLNVLIIFFFSFSFINLLLLILF